jgi:DNA-binding MarR family transcriptional regulator
VAQRIGPDGTRLTELAEAAQVTKQTAGFLVDQLERAGYVERVPDPRDAGAKLIRLATRSADRRRRR